MLFEKNMIKKENMIIPNRINWPFFINMALFIINQHILHYKELSLMFLVFICCMMKEERNFDKQLEPRWTEDYIKANRKTRLCEFLILFFMFCKYCVANLMLSKVFFLLSFVSFLLWMIVGNNQDKIEERGKQFKLF